jgi:DNA-binding CsgD family transcriptional regulator
MSGPVLTDEIVGQLYDCVLNPDGWRDLLAQCAQLVGGDTAVVYVRAGGKGKAGKVLTSAGCDFDARVGRYLSYYEPRSPLIPIYRQLPTAKVHALGEYAFSATYRRTEFYHDWIRPQGWADMVGSHLVRSPELYAWMSIRRGEGRKTYSSREIRDAGRLAGHLGRAIKLRSRFETECANADSLRGSLQQVGFGILIVDVCAKVLMANGAAETILGLGRGLKNRRGALVCEVPRESSALHDAIRAAAQGLATHPPAATDFTVSRGDGQRPLVVHILPVGSAWSGFAPPRAAAAVFVIDPHVSIDQIDGLSAAYSLTPGERRVLAEIVQCTGLVEAAAKLQVAIPTARTHLQNIFAKTDTSNQAELIRLALTSSLAPVVRRP